MRTLYLSAMMAAACLSAGVAGAQTGSKSAQKKNSVKEETVILKNNDSKTVVEIRDGNVYVNGEKMVSVEDGSAGTIRKKIIIENDGTVSGMSGDAMKSFEQFFGQGFNQDGEGAMGSRKAMLGVVTAPDTDGKGALVQQVTPGSAAEKAGLKEGDRITKVDDEKVADPKDLVDVIRKYEAGDNITVTYERDGRTATAKAALGKATAPQSYSRSFTFGPNGGWAQEGDMPNSLFTPFGNMADMMPVDRPRLGVSVEDMADSKGVKVLDVKPGSAAEKAGLQKDDIIESIGEDKTTTVDALQSAVQGMEPGNSSEITYRRDGVLKTGKVMLPKAMKRKDL